MPATKVVQPRRKKSQWKPPGFFSGYWRACAVMELTFFDAVSTDLMKKANVAYVVIVEEQHDEETKR